MQLVTDKKLEAFNKAPTALKKPDRSKQCFLFLFYFVLFAIFILHSRESELYRYTLDGKSAPAWELKRSAVC